MSQSAALSYYAVFSIAPLILISLAVSGFLFGEEASKNQIFHSFAEFTQSYLENKNTQELSAYEKK